MNNFQFSRDDSHLKYRDEIVIDEKKSTAVDVEVYYSLGGMNYFHGKVNGRGIYISITPVELEKRDGYISTSCRLMGDVKTSGAKVFIKELKRKNVKELVRIAEKLDTDAPEITKLFRAGQIDEAFDKIRALKELATV